MQRSLPHQSAGLTSISALLLLCYPVVGSLYPVFPPLLGVVYLKWRDAIKGTNYPAALYWLLYPLVFEAVWSLPFYGLWVTMILTYRVIEPRIDHLLFDRITADIVTVVLFNGTYLLVLLFYQSVTDQIFFTWHPILLYYLLFDMAGVLLF